MGWRIPRAGSGTHPPLKPVVKHSHTALAERSANSRGMPTPRSRVSPRKQPAFWHLWGTGGHKEGGVMRPRRGVCWFSKSHSSTKRSSKKRKKFQRSPHEGKPRRTLGELTFVQGGPVAHGGQTEDTNRLPPPSPGQPTERSSPLRAQAQRPLGGCGCPRARHGAQAGHSPPHLLSGVQGSIHTGYGQRHASRGARRPRPAPLLRCTPRHAHEACGTQPSSVQTSVGCPGAAPSGSAPARRRRWPLWGAGRRHPGGTGSFTPLPHCSYPSCSGCGGEPKWSKLTLVWHRTRRGGSWGAAAPGSCGSTTWRSQRAAVGCRFACGIGIFRVQAVPPSILRWPGDPQSVGFLLPAAFWPACKCSTPKSSPKCTSKHIDRAVYIPISKRNQECSPNPINYAYLVFIRRDCPRSAPFQAGESSDPLSPGGVGRDPRGVVVSSSASRKVEV